MLERLRDRLLAVLRVPSGVHPPAGDPARTRVFRAAPAFFRYRVAVWALAQLGALVGLVVGYLVLRQIALEVERDWFTWGLRAVEAVGVLTFLANVAVSLAVLRLDFEQRWYAVTDRALRIREGILVVREQTMTFANIQQVGIRQGPVQRWLGIADVHVSTAGGAGGGTEHGGVGRGMHEGFFRGVGNAAEIRDLIRERVRRHRDAGLGDPDDAEHVPASVEAEPLAAVHALHDEVRALARTLGAGRAAPTGQS